LQAVLGIGGHPGATAVSRSRIAGHVDRLVHHEMKVAARTRCRVLAQQSLRRVRMVSQLLMTRPAFYS
jgi:hypothetical protein